MSLILARFSQKKTKLPREHARNGSSRPLQQLSIPQQKAPGIRNQRVVFAPEYRPAFSKHLYSPVFAPPSNNGLINHEKWCKALDLTFHLVLARRPRRRLFNNAVQKPVRKLLCKFCENTEWIVHPLIITIFEESRSPKSECKLPT